MARPKGTNTKSNYIGLRLSDTLAGAIAKEIELTSEEGVNTSVMIRALVIEAIKERRNKRKTITPN